MLSSSANREASSERRQNGAIYQIFKDHSRKPSSQFRPLQIAVKPLQIAVKRFTARQVPSERR
jgi:hypothetical protein